MRTRGRLRGWFVCSLAFFVSGATFAQERATPQLATVSAVMLSDLHFDPFHDPAKVSQLVKAPVEEWAEILKSPDSATQETDFAWIQESCEGKQQVDAPYVMLRSSLHAAKVQVPDAQFVTVSGDLLVHDLDCRYRAAMKLGKPKGDDQSVSAAFAKKTTVFVMNQVESVFAGIPVYMALGNNDSRCNHNRLGLHDGYLKATGQAVINGLVGVSAAERRLALNTYQSAGYYGVTMSAPIRRTRLLVLDDIYFMSKFENCEADETDRKGEQEQIAWLTKELDGARRRGEMVWVLGHVPPAVNPQSSLAKGDLCAGGKVDTFLSSDDLTSALINHADVVRLALFGHTHMDELHLLLGSKGAGVPVKVVASVSAVSGNRPSFTVGRLAPASATLVDYTVYEASNTTGVGTPWAKEYGFDETYHETSFSANSLYDLIGRLHADTPGSGAESRAYQLHYFKGASTPELEPRWSGYVCSLDHPTAEGFRACVCGSK